MIDVGLRAKLLGYLGAANVHVEYQVKKNPDALRPELLRLCQEIYAVRAETLDELASKIDDLGKAMRKHLCVAYRAAHGLPHPQLHKHQSGVLSRINDFPAKPQKLKLAQNQPEYEPPTSAPEPMVAVIPSAKKLRKLYLATRKEKRAARKDRRRAALNDVASKPRTTRPSSAAPSETAIREFYASWEWKRLSYDVKLERGRTCECCGAKAPDVRIHTDHVKPLRRYWGRRLDRSNLQVLCEDCNMGKGSRDETDFRQKIAGPSSPAHDDDIVQSILDGPPPSDEPVVWN